MVSLKKRSETVPRATVSREALLEILSQLKIMIKGFDPMSEEFWIEKKDAFQGQGVDEEITRMENHLRNYNFERAADFIGRVEQGIQG